MKINPWIRFLFPFSLLAFFSLLIYLFNQFREPPGFEWYGLFSFGIMIFATWELGWYISRQLDRTLPWHANHKMRMIQQLAWTNLGGQIIFVLGLMILNGYENQFENKDNPLSLVHVFSMMSQAFILIQAMNSFQIGYSLLKDRFQLNEKESKRKRIAAVNQLQKLREEGSKISNPMELGESNQTESIPELGHYINELIDQIQHLKTGLRDIEESLLEEDIALGFNTQSVAFQTPRLMVKSGTKLISLSYENIAMAYKDELTFILDITGNRYLVEHTLETLYKLLPNESFFKINRQVIIAWRWIDHVAIQGKSMEVVPSMPAPRINLQISQRNQSAFRLWLDGRSE